MSRCSNTQARDKEANIDNESSSALKVRSEGIHTKPSACWKLMGRSPSRPERRTCIALFGSYDMRRSLACTRSKYHASVSATICPMEVMDEIFVSVHVDKYVPGSRSITSLSGIAAPPYEA